MVVAVAKAARGGRERDRLRVDRQHLGVGGRVRRARPGWRSSSSCRRARSRSASCSRRSSPGRGSSPSTATSTRRCAIVRALAEQDDHPVTLVNSVNPFRLEGQKTAAFEICDDLGRAPDVLAIPVGNAGNISAYWAGFREYADGRARPRRRPAMWGFQAAGAAPIVAGHGSTSPRPIATAIRIGDPASWDKAVAARDESGGRIAAVTDDEILAAYRDARPARGRVLRARVGGQRRRRHARPPRPASSTRTRSSSCVLTGHGLKDPTTAEREVRRRHRVRADARRGRRRAGLGSGDGRDTGWPSSTAAGSRSTSRRRPRTSGPATTASGVALELHEPGRARGPRLEPRRDRADRRRRGRGELAGDRDEPVRRGARGGAARRSRRPAPTASAGGSRCTTRSRWRAVSGRPRRPRSPGSWPANALIGRRRCDRASSCGSRPTIEGHPDNAAAALLGGFVVSAPTRRRGRGRPLRCAARPARGPLHPRAAPVDRTRCEGAAGRGPAARTRSRTWRRSRRRRRARHRAGPTCSRADRGPAPRAVSSGGVPELPRLVAAARATRARSVRACRCRLDDHRLRRLDGRDHADRGAFVAAAADTDLPGRVTVVEPRNTGARVVARA